MKFTLGAAVAVATLIGSILIGGINFGELRGNVADHKNRLDDLQERVRELEEEQKANVRVINDLEWVKRALDRKGRE